MKAITHPVRVVFTHPLTVAFGLANLYMIALTGPLIDPDHDLVYHLIGVASVIFVPVLIYVVALWGLLAALLYVARRPGRRRVIIWSALLLVLPWVLLETVASLLEVDVPDWLSRVLGFSVLIALAGIAALGKRAIPAFQKVRPVAASLFGIFAVCGIWIFVQLAWCGLRARHLNGPPPLHRATQTASGVVGGSRQRIIWILLDELSYRQLYERRFAGLALPAFDRLAAQSTVFTQVVPTGEFTRYIIPSLFSGVPASGVIVSASGRLLATHDKVSGRTTRFVARQTVFQDAIDAGYKTGIAGWYNPYCRMMPEVLDKCFWMYHEGIPGSLSPDRSMLQNLLVPLRLLRLSVRHFFGLGRGAPSEELQDIQMHSTDYRDLLAAGDNLLEDASVDFSLLHMPIPHPYGFYDRKTNEFTQRHSSYIDNLALTNLYLAHIRRLLERQGQWDSSVVVVMGDHGWRTKLIWRSSPGWTAEDEAANAGGQDERPALLVKMPNQHQGARYDGRFEAIRTRALMDAVMRGQVRTPGELSSWAGQQK